MNVYLIVHPVPNNLNEIIKKPAYVIAVDQGLFDAYKQGVLVDLAIGDFDSLKDVSLLEKVKSIKLDPVKDKTDTESAFEYACTLKPKHITIVGGLGGARFEHSYANLLLLFEYDDLSIITEHTKIVKYGVGTYIEHYSEYISIFTEDRAIISLKGFKYDLNRYGLNKLDRLGISNELMKQTGEIKVHAGSIVIMYTKKDQ